MNFTIQPRPYQLRALRACAKKKRFGLFFEMGTGKTKVICDLFYLGVQAGKISRMLIAAPLSVLGVWENELKKNIGGTFAYFLLKPEGSIAERAVQIEDFWSESELPHILLINYEASWRLIDELIAWKPQVVVADESHRIKNPQAKQSKAMWKLGEVAEYAFCLTGTPIAHNPLDLWSQFQFLNPEVFDCRFRQFKYHYGVWGGYGGFKLIKYKNLEEMTRRIKPWAMVLKKKDYLDLPEKTFIEVPIRLPDSAAKLYKQMEDDFLLYIGEEVVEAPIAITKMMKLSQICGGFIRHTEKGENIPLHDEKVKVLRDLLEDFGENGETRVVVFARFRYEIEVIKQSIKDWQVLEIHGGVSEKQRSDAISKFQGINGGRYVLICQIASGSLGINLHSSHIAVFYSLDYSFASYLQAVDRIHRIGQSRPCLYYHLLVEGSIDFEVLQAVRQKRDVLDVVMERVKGGEYADY